MRCLWGVAPRVGRAMQAFARLTVAMAVVVAACPAILLAIEESASYEVFAGDRPLRAIAYSFPTTVAPNALPPLCMLARDLPLIAESGANVVYTQGIPPHDGDYVFLNLLDSTGLAWVAGYSLPEGTLPELTLLEQRDALVADFSEFAARFAGNRSLRGVVLDFGKDRVAQTGVLANDFASILEAYFPTQTPRLGQVAHTPATLDGGPAGLGFWVYRFAGTQPNGLTRMQLKQRTQLPVLFDLSEVAQAMFPDNAALPPMPGATWTDYLQVFTANDPLVPVVALRFQGERNTETGGYRHAESALFQGFRDTAGFESLYPTVLTEEQRALWEAAPLENHASSPTVTAVRNSGSNTPQFSPGARITVEGALFRMGDDALTNEGWPLHAGAVCVCVDDRPIPIGALQRDMIAAQLPWLLGTGPRDLRVVREGVAGARQTLDLQEFAPGIFLDALGYAQTVCGPVERTGLKAGETLELRATGAGTLNGGAGDLQVSLDGTALDLVHVGLASEEPGIAVIRAEVRERNGATGAQGLRLRRGGRVSNVLPISYASLSRPAITLVASAATVQVQPKGSATPIGIETQGTNGFCGLVDFEVLGLPQGVTAVVSPVRPISGQPTTLQLRADSTAMPVQGHAFYLYGLPAGGDPQMLTLRLDVLPSTGRVVVTAESAGFSAGSIARMQWNGEVLEPTGGQDARGMYLLLVNAASGNFAPVEQYDLWESEEESARLEARLRSLPQGMIVAMAIADEATLQMQDSLRELIRERLGSQAIMTLGYQHSWAIIGAVGADKPLAEAAAADAMVMVQTTLELPR